MRHCVAEKVHRHTIYAILESSEHFPPQRVNESGKIAKNVQKASIQA